MYQWRHYAAWWDNAMDQLERVPSAHLEICFWTEKKAILNVLNDVSSFNIDTVYTVMEDLEHF